MPRSKIDFETVRKIALEFSGVEESTAYGSPALRVRGKLLACIPVNKAAEPESLAVSTDRLRREELLAEDPGVYYLAEHYVNYPLVLVRLSRIHPDALRDLLSAAWRFVTAKSPAKRRTNPKRSGSRSRK